MLQPIPGAGWAQQRAVASAALALVFLLFATLAVATDQGGRQHAKGAYDASTSTYDRRSRGDDLAAIAARFGIDRC
jgi:hypothetical protein